MIDINCKKIIKNKICVKYLKANKLITNNNKMIDIANILEIILR